MVTVPLSAQAVRQDQSRDQAIFLRCSPSSDETLLLTLLIKKKCGFIRYKPSINTHIKKVSIIIM